MGVVAHVGESNLGRLNSHPAMNKIGPQIKDMREAQGISQGRLAAKLGVRQQTVADWENGKAERLLTVMRRLFAMLFGHDEKK